MKFLFQTEISDLVPRSAAEIHLRVTVRYAGVGLVIGLAMLLAAWWLELGTKQMDLTFDSIVELHRASATMWLLDLLPIFFALLLGRLGMVQARLALSNQDLEERVRERTMESTLEKARTSAIIDNAADAIIAFGQNGSLVLFNNAAEKLFGYRLSEAIQRDVRTLIPSFAQVTDDNYLGFMKSIQATQTPGSTPQLSGLAKDGTNFPIEVDISEFSLGDDVSYTLIIRDLTQRRRQERLERSLLQVSEAVNQSEDLDELYQAIHESLGQIIDVTNFYIALLEPDRANYRIVFCVDEKFEKPENSLPLDQSVVKLVIDSRRPMLLKAADFKRLSLEGTLRSLQGRASVSWLGVPLISNGETIGAMAVHSHEEGVFYTEKDVWILNLVSGQIANAIEREHARDLLRQSEKRYRRMVEEAGDIVFTTDKRGRFTYVNPPIMKLTGYQENELIGRKSSMLIDEEWIEQVRSFYMNQIKNKSRETIHEFPIRTKGGQQRWIEQTTTLLFEKGELVGFQAIVHDITERRDVEWALREREERFRSLSASSPIGVFQVNPGGQCTYTNKRWQEITGRSLAESLGEGWLEAIHPKDRQTFKIEWIFSRDEATATGREVRVQAKDLEIRWVSIRWASTFDDYQQLTGYVGTFEDITARKKTEQLNRVLYEISQAASQTDDLSTFFGSIHQSLASVIDTTNFYIALYNQENGTISFPYAREGETDLNLVERPAGKGLTGYVIRLGKSLLLDEDGLSRLYQSGDVVPVGKPTRNWLGVPLLIKGGVIGAVVLQSYTTDKHFSEVDLQTITFVSSQIAGAVQRKRAEEDRRRYTLELAEAHNRIKDDLRIAARIQHSRLPQEKLEVPGVEFGWLFNACEEVAGDMFNFIQLSEFEVGVYILDVSGHGVPAALLSMALSRSMTAASDGSGALLRLDHGHALVASPAEVAEVMNRRFPMNLEINQYFTFLYGVLDLRTHAFRFTRAGHPSPVLVRAGKAFELDEALGPAIGIIPEMVFPEHSIQLEPGDEIIFYTDGIDEAANAKGEEFGVPRILQSLSGQAASIEQDIEGLRESVRVFTGGSSQSDDITIVGFRLVGIPAPIASTSQGD